MRLPGAPAGSRGVDVPDLAARHSDLRGAFADLFEIDLEGAALIKRAQSRDAVADASEEHAEMRLA